MSEYLIYHHPRCSKSREALALLEAKGVTFQIKKYLVDGIDEDDVVFLTKALGMHPSEFIRKNEPEYKALGTDEFSIEEWSAIISNQPILLQRPIVCVGNQAVIARPIEALEKFLEKVQG